MKPPIWNAVAAGSRERRGAIAASSRVFVISIERAFLSPAAQRLGLARDQRGSKIKECGITVGRPFLPSSLAQSGAAGVGRIALAQDGEGQVFELGEVEIGKADRAPSRAEGHGNGSVALGLGQARRLAVED